MNGPFYIGYLPQAPPAVASIIRRTVMGLMALVLIVALVLVFAQEPFPAASFEYGLYRDFEGVVEERPYPALLVPSETGFSRYWLVAPGKHGASAEVMALNGSLVRLRGQRIYRGPDAMLELEANSVRAAGRAPSGSLPETTRVGPVNLAGEIADSKCYFGVMNPGRGKVHRGCAARCLSGGIPPVLVSGDRTYVLTGPDGQPIGGRLLDLVAQPVELQGELFHASGTRL
ncbi:MAG: hypothetical protein HYR60_18160, partial [Acidobacteria bacterium]|nr:hypothetical protein [Acidobacteriota bacterium]